MSGKGMGMNNMGNMGMGNFPPPPPGLMMSGCLNPAEEAMMSKSITELKSFITSLGGIIPPPPYLKQDLARLAASLSR